MASGLDFLGKMQHLCLETFLSRLQLFIKHLLMVKYCEKLSRSTDLTSLLFCAACEHIKYKNHLHNLAGKRYQNIGSSLFSV